MNAYESARALERRTLQNRTAVVLLIVAVCIAIAAAVYVAGVRHERRASDAARDARARDTIVKAIPVVEQRIRVDTVRIRVAEQKAKIAIVAFDSAAAIVEAVADTSSVVPAALVIPEIQQCRDMRDDLLDEIDTLKVTIADLTNDAALQKRRAELAERESARARARPHLGFRSGLIAGAAAVLTVIHFAR